MSSTLTEFQQKFRLDELSLQRSEHWTWSLRPVPITLGAGILSLNRFCTSFAELSPAEGAELAAIARSIDARLQKAFAPDRMNYLMLMMVDRHLHFHVVPRYAQIRHFGGMPWEDKAWPKPPDLGVYADRADSSVLSDIHRALLSDV